MALTNPDYFLDGFDWYAAADAPMKYNGGGTFNAMISGAAPATRYSYGQAAQNVGTGPTHNWAADKAYIIGGFTFIDTPADKQLIRFASILGGASAITLETTSGGILKLDHDGGTNICTSVGGVFTAATWHHIGFAIRVHPSAGRAYIWRDSELVAETTIDTDTEQVASRSIGTFRYNATGIFDDLWMVRGDGISLASLIEEWEEIGDQWVSRYMPPSNGDDADGTPSAGTNYQTVDEIPTSTADYNTLAAAGDRDLYPMATLDANVGAISMVQATHVALHEPASGTPQKTKNVLKIAGDLEYGIEHTIAGLAKAYFDIFRVNPNNGLPWTKSGLEAAQRGYEKTE